MSHAFVAKLLPILGYHCNSLLRKALFQTTAAMFRMQFAGVIPNMMHIIRLDECNQVRDLVPALHPGHLFHAANCYILINLCLLGGLRASSHGRT